MTKRHLQIATAILGAVPVLTGIIGMFGLFRVVWGMIFLGGVGRLLSTVFSGMPPSPFIGFTALEIVGAPFFVAWQSRLARAS